MNQPVHLLTISKSIPKSNSSEKQFLIVQKRVFLKLKELQENGRNDLINEFNELISIILGNPCHLENKAVLPVDSIKSSTRRIKVHFSRSKDTLSIFSIFTYFDPAPDPDPDPDDGCELIILPWEFSKVGTLVLRHYQLSRNRKENDIRKTRKIDMYQATNKDTFYQDASKQIFLTVAASVAFFVFVFPMLKTGSVRIFDTYYSSVSERTLETTESIYSPDIDNEAVTPKDNYIKVVQSPEYLAIAKEDVNLREGPSLKHDVKFQLNLGDRLKKILRVGNWVYVEVLDMKDIEGWVHKRLVTHQTDNWASLNEKYQE